MREISNRAKSNSRSNCNGENSTVTDSDERFEHIKSANRKVRLIDILRNYGFKIEKNYQRPAWSSNIICPLPNHKSARERTPSFGYCFISDHFFCLGCNQTGRAVEFISAYEGVSRTIVAERILAQYGEDLSEEDFNEYKDDLTPILFDGALFFQKLIRQHKDNPVILENIEKLLWWIDFYLMTKAPGKKIEQKELQYRIDKVKELLSK